MASKGWRLLNVRRSKNLPPLLVQSHINREKLEYVVRVTDFNQIWEDVASASDIKSRARKEGTSIDPSEDVSQFRILLEKIEGAISGSPESSLELDEEELGDGFTLTTLSKLPAPLPVLRWNIHLTLRQGQQTGLTVPLVGDIYSQKQQIDDLAIQLHDKDQIISRLLDRLESSGHTLSEVFHITGQGSRKTTSREAAAKIVKGLSTFDREKWQKQWAQKASDEELRDGYADLVISKVFGGGKSPSPEDQSSTELGDTSTRDMAEKKKSEPTAASMVHRGREPTGPKQHAKQSDSDTEETETDDDDLDAVPSRKAAHRKVGASSSSSTHPKSSPPKRVGAIGASKPKPPPKPTPPPAQDEGSETETESEGVPEKASPVKSSPKPISKPPPRRLGAIGARKPPPSPSREYSSEPEPAPRAGSGRLGKIGGRKRQEESVSRQATQSPVPVAKAPSPTPEKESKVKAPSDEEEEESDETKARRKRGELKRALESKAPVPGKKKRRKF
ncbi:XLF-domain-containing protein [Aulographum hederae CBS 113979]|uniref:Non-homologous end-joining factor 1 n=1 Tax=Aulographum hederae CBS 113979 TaxID=1176131 RepID=A0A6G1GMG4_9PEZI|nr:XLF-domain-containing protein [Aulographum hederae CBS 113979]